MTIMLDRNLWITGHLRWNSTKFVCSEADQLISKVDSDRNSPSTEKSQNQTFKCEAGKCGQYLDVIVGSILPHGFQPWLSSGKQNGTFGGLFSHLPCSKLYQEHLSAYRKTAMAGDRKSTRLNSSHGYISYAVFCLKKKNKNKE